MHRASAPDFTPPVSSPACRWLRVISLLALFGVQYAHADNDVQSRLSLQSWPQVTVPASSAQVEQRVEKLLASLSTAEKVGQIIQADIGSVTPEDVRRYRLGSVLNGGDSGPGGNDLASAGHWLALADAFHAAAMDTRAGGHAIPLLWGTDAVHGHNNIIGATLFPHNIGLGATGNAGLIQRIAAITALEVRVTGQEWTFAPTVAVAQDLRWGRSYESFTADPQRVAEYSRSMVLGLQGAANTADFLRGPRVIASAKHFIGDGATWRGQDQGDARIGADDLREVHAAGYVTALSAGVQTIMASYSSWRGQKLHGHAELLTNLLKRHWGFDGFVVGDWNGHGQVPGCTNTRCAAAFNAGIDMFMAPDSWRELYQNTLSQVEAGEISAARLDDAVRRILRVKLRAGLFELGAPSSRPFAGRFELLGAPEHLAVARQAVRESLVLLKNCRRTLPLDPGGHLLVTGQGAHDLPMQSGGWTLTWQGTGIDNSHFPNGESIFTGIEAAATAAGGSAEVSADGRFQRRPDAAVLVIGEQPYAEFEGDVTSLAYPPQHHHRDLQLLRSLREQDIPVVVVVLSGRPLWIDDFLHDADALIAAWLPGSQGGGVADVLVAGADRQPRHDFLGRLPFAWPASGATETTPPRFALGHGLDYSSPDTCP